MKTILTTIFAVILALNSFATAQFGDILIVGGETNSIRSNPLENYFEETKTVRPDFDQYFGGGCTACWRGYIATWEIKDESLSLVKIQDYRLKKEFPIKKIFSEPSPIKANWFSGDLSIPMGECLDYIHMGYGSTYEKETRIQVNRGDIIATSVINHRDRWIAQSKEILNVYQAFGDTLPSFRFDKDHDVAELLDLMFVFMSDWVPHEGAVKFRDIRFKFKIEINADLEGFQLRESHKKLSYYDLLTSIAEETGATLIIKVEDGSVIYEMKETTHFESKKTPYKAGASLEEQNPPAKFLSPCCTNDVQSLDEVLDEIYGNKPNQELEPTRKTPVESGTD